MNLLSDSIDELVPGEEFSGLVNSDEEDNMDGRQEMTMSDEEDDIANAMEEGMNEEEEEVDEEPCISLA